MTPQRETPAAGKGAGILSAGFYRNGEFQTIATSAI